MTAIQTSIDVPGYSGGYAPVQEGQLFRVTDVEGCQIGDLFVLSSADTSEYLSPAWTKQVLFRTVPKPGDLIYSNRHRPLLEFVTDTSPGIHDMSFAPCDPIMYEMIGAQLPHPSCYENFFKTVAANKLDCPQHPDPFNLFQNTVPDAEGNFIVGQTLSKAGDYVEFRALMDVIVIVTACSVDIEFDGVQANGGKSTPLRIDVYS